MATLADILAAAIKGNHPMGGHMRYDNERLEGPGPVFPERLLEGMPWGWAPPSQQPPLPPRDTLPQPPDAFPIPNAHPGRLNLRRRGSMI